MRMFLGAFATGFFSYLVYRVSQALWQLSWQEQTQQWPR